MTKQFSLKQLFSLIDGEPSPIIDDILNHVCDTNIPKTQMLAAYFYLKLKNPQWFIQLKAHIDFMINKFCPIKEESQEQFDWLVKFINNSKGDIIYNIPQLKDEFDTSDLWLIH